MLQKSVENLAENDIKFKELVKDAVREELKYHKEYINELHRERTEKIFEILKINKEILEN